MQISSSLEYLLTTAHTRQAVYSSAKHICSRQKTSSFNYPTSEIYNQLQIYSNIFGESNCWEFKRLLIKPTIIIPLIQGNLDPFVDDKRMKNDRLSDKSVPKRAAPFDLHLKLPEQVPTARCDGCAAGEARTAFLGQHWQCETAGLDLSSLNHRNDWHQRNICICGDHKGSAQSQERRFMTLAVSPARANRCSRRQSWETMLRSPSPTSPTAAPMKWDTAPH